MKLLWLTSGYSWGFRFLRDGGAPDPLVEYERHFPTSTLEPEFFTRTGDTVALRLTDPEGRKDDASRPISHDFVIYPPESKQLSSLSEARSLVWPLVAEEYASKY